MTSRPAAPESETPETDARIVEVSRAFVVQAYGGDFPQNRSMVTADFARSLERRLSLAQTEIKGHMRIEDDLDAEVIALNGIIRVRTDALSKAQSRIAELEKDAARYRWLRENAETINGAKINWHWQDEHRPHPPMQDLDSAIDAALKSRA